MKTQTRRLGEEESINSRRQTRSDESIARKGPHYYRDQDIHGLLCAAQPRRIVGMRAVCFIGLGVSAGCGFILQCFGWAFDREGVEWLAVIFFFAALCTVLTGLLSRIRLR